jgi:hypothetical protein
MKSTLRYVRGWFVLLILGNLLAGMIRPHAEDGLIALYTFHEGSGTTIHDVSGVGDPLNLTIPNLPGITWLPGGGISINEGQIIGSGAPATKVIQAVQETSEITIETWIKPDSLNQLGPARVVTLSAHTTDRNFTLGLENVTWNSGHHLALGAELTGERPWLGEMHKIAIYNRALTAIEIGEKLDELTPALERRTSSPRVSSPSRITRAGRERCRSCSRPFRCVRMESSPCTPSRKGSEASFGTVLG